MKFLLLFLLSTSVYAERINTLPGDCVKLTGGDCIYENELSALSGVTSPIQDQIDDSASESDLTAHEADVSTHGASAALVGTVETQTLTNKTLTAPVITAPTGIVKADVGLGNVDNTTDLAKPVSTATQTALDLKSDDLAVVHKAGTETITGDKTYSGQLTNTSTTKGNTVCPVMTDTQMLAISSPRNGDCVFNSTKKAPYYYNTTDVKWKLAGGGGGAGGGIELMLDPSFEDATNSDYTSLTGATASLVASTLPGTFNEKMLRLAFTSSGSIITSKTTGSGYTGATVKVGAYVYTTRSDVTFEPTLSAVADGRTCALAANAWTYCYFEIPAHLNPGWKVNSPTAATHTVDIEWATIAVSEKFSAVMNLNNIEPWTTGTCTSSWTTTATTTCKYRRIGDSVEVSTSVVANGAVTAIGLTTSLPSGLTMDTSKFPTGYTIDMIVGSGSALDSGVSSYSADISYADTQNVYVRALGTTSSYAGIGGLVTNTVPFTFGAVDTVFLNYKVPIVGWTASSPNIVTTNDVFSTDTASLFFKSTACLSTEIGCFNTWAYLTPSSNVKTLCTSAPSQTIASMNANGVQIFTRAYNAASTCGNPVRVELVTGQSYKGITTNLYKNTGKSVSGNMDPYLPISTYMYGLQVKEYSESSGVLTLDGGYVTATSVTGHVFFFSDMTDQAYGYLTVSASKNPALNGINVGTVAARGVNSSGQSFANGVSTAVAWDSAKTFDTHGALNTSTGVFTCPPGQSGYYQVNSSFLTANVPWSTGHSVELILSKNGGIYSDSYSFAQATATYFIRTNHSDTVYLAAGDTLAIYLNISRGASTTLNNQAIFNYFSIYKLSIGN